MYSQVGLVMQHALVNDAVGLVAMRDGRPFSVGGITARGENRVIRASELAGLIDEDRPLAVEFGQYSSAITLLMEELGGVRFNAPSAWREAVVSELGARDLAALRPFVTSHPRDLPSSLCVLPHRTRTGLPSLEDDLERIAAIPPDVFADQLPDDGNWDAVARHPARWLGAFAQAVRRACAGFRGPWTEATALLEREAERVGAASVRGSLHELIAARFPPAMLKLDSALPHGAEPSRRLGLVPMLAGPHAAHTWITDGQLSHIAYPLPGAWRVLDGEAPPPASLEGLLGPQRAQILRRLDRSATVGEVAEALIAVPSAATHHVATMERAGLVARERRGQRVFVERTARGTELLALYDD